MTREVKVKNPKSKTKAAKPNKLTHRGQDPVIIENQIKAVSLRAAGFSIRAIAEQMGVSATTCHTWVKKAIAELAAERSAETLQMRTYADIQYDQMLKHWNLLASNWQARNKGDAVADIEQMRIIEGIDKMRLTILQAKRALWGLDAPVKVALEGGQQPHSLQISFVGGQVAKKIKSKSRKAKVIEAESVEVKAAEASA